MKILLVLADFWLPEFKFGPGRCAMALAKASWYWVTAARNTALIAEWCEDISTSLSESDERGKVAYESFRKRLQELGWIVGRNLNIDHRWEAKAIQI